MNTEIITSEDLKNVFYSGYPASTSWNILDELYIAIHEHALIYSKHSVSTIEHYHNLIDTVGPAEGLGPQKAGHMALKTVATEWLDQKYRVKANTEFYFCGLHPDVISVDRHYVIECGTTDPGCITMYLSESEVLLAGNIAYPFAEDTLLYLHAFKKGPAFRTWQEQKISSLREVFRKHRTTKLS